MTVQFRVSRELRGEIAFSFLKYTLKAGQILSLSDDVAASHEIQIALSKKMISPFTKSEDTAEKVVIPVEKIHKSNIRETLIEEIPDEVVTERKTTMLAYDMETGEMMGKSKSQKMALERMNIEDKTEVLSGDKIDFDAPPKKKTRKQNKTGESATPKKEKKSGIKPVGVKRDEAAIEDTSDFLIDGPGFNDIDFVDEEQTRERANNRPILKDNNNEVT